MSGNGQGPKSGKMVGNGPRMVARACQGSPELPTVLRFWLRAVPGPGRTAKGQFWPKLTIQAATPCLKISTRNTTFPGLGSCAGVIVKTLATARGGVQASEFAESSF